MTRTLHALEAGLFVDHRSSDWLRDNQPSIHVQRQPTTQEEEAIPWLSGVSLLQIPRCFTEKTCMHECIQSMWARMVQRIRTRHGHE